MKEITSALETLTGTCATAERLSDFCKWDWEDNDRWLIHMGEYALFIFTQYNKPGRLSISVRYPVGKHLHHGDNPPLITCAASRSPEAIAKDITRRILPAVPEWLEEVKGEHAREQKYNARCKEVKDFVWVHGYHGPIKMDENGDKVRISGYLTIEQAKKLLEVSL